jgi:hypothetical protein
MFPCVDGVTRVLDECELVGMFPGLGTCTLTGSPMMHLLDYCCTCNGDVKQGNNELQPLVRRPG